MSYKLTSPCPHCPFRTDIAPFLRKGRIDDIERSLIRSEFPCHKTTHEQEQDEEHYTPNGKEEHCAGALILLEKLERPSQMMRICERLGLYDARKLDMNAPVFDSFEEMRAAQTK